MKAAIRNTSKASEASPRNTSSRTTSTTPSRSTPKTKPRSKLRVAPITIHAGLQYSDSPLVKMHVCTYIQNYAWLVEDRGVTNEDAIAKLEAHLFGARTKEGLRSKQYLIALMHEFTERLESEGVNPIPALGQLEDFLFESILGERPPSCVVNLSKQPPTVSATELKPEGYKPSLCIQALEQRILELQAEEAGGPVF